MQSFQDKIDCFIQIPNIGRGKIKYIGPVENKNGYFVGVDLLANIGKNDGSFLGTRYFSTEYPQSGLFIQFPKVAHLVEQASRVALESVPVTRNTTSVVKESPRRNLEGQLPPATPRRSMMMKNNIKTMTIPDLRPHQEMIPVVDQQNHNNNNDDDDDSMEIDAFSSSVMVDQPLSPEQRQHQQQEQQQEQQQKQQQEDAVMKLNIQQSMNTIEQQRQTIEKYEVLLNEQRVVLEEIQPIMDACEQKSQLLLEERNRLEEQVTLQQSAQQKQRAEFIQEQEQLMAAVDKLNEEIKENEIRMSQNSTASESVTTVLTSNNDNEELEHLRKYKQDMTTAKVKWDKEKEQLRMHNESLSKEYKELNKELMAMSNDAGASKQNEDSDKLMKQIDRLEQQLSDARKQIKELKASKHQEEERSQYCVLCEKSGHDQLHCPSQYAST